MKRTLKRELNSTWNRWKGSRWVQCLVRLASQSGPAKDPFVCERKPLQGGSEVGTGALRFPGPLDALWIQGKARGLVAVLRSATAFGWTLFLWWRNLRARLFCRAELASLEGHGIELWKKCFFVVHWVCWFGTLSFYRSRVNALTGPVLKHGPRSLTCMRVVGWKTWRRNESKGRLGLLRWESLTGGTINRSWSSVNDLSESISVGTRKMVNYACIGRSQRKLWWRLVAILTCKSFVKYGYRGERLIEPSSSWFPPKFPSG